MSIRHTVLGLLARGPHHGYELRSAFEERLVPGGKLNIGQVYTTLERLERDGLAEHERVAQSERPDKKVFDITEAGRAELQRWLQSPSPPQVDLRNETYLKLAVARELDGVDVASVLRHERESCFARLQETVQARARSVGGDLAEQLLLDLAVRQLEAFLGWLEHCTELLAEEGTP